MTGDHEGYAVHNLNSHIQHNCLQDVRHYKNIGGLSYFPGQENKRPGEGSFYGLQIAAFLLGPRVAKRLAPSFSQDIILAID